MTGHPEAHWRIIHSEVSTGWGGQIEVRHAGQLLPCRAFFDKDSCVQPGAIVANKRLDATLARIQEAQQQRDRQRLANPNLTLRQKSRIRAAQERADAPAPAR